MRKPSTLNTLGALSILALQLFTGLTAAFQATRHIERRGVISTLAKQHGGCFQDNFKQRHGTVLNIYMTSNREDESAGSVILLRDRLRQATGFSLTAVRAALRAATGISLTTIYGTAVAASGLWIRKTTSVVLAVFPAWFRYFLQPILIAYYLPIFIVRGLTGPTRKQAKAKHLAVKESWKDAIRFAKQTENTGYWPVRINGAFTIFPIGIQEC